MSAVETIYSGAATIGEIKSVVYLIVGLCLTLCLSMSASFSIMYKSPRTAETQANVVDDSDCKEHTTKTSDGKTHTNTQCLTNIKYNIANQTLTKNIPTGSQSLRSGNTITIKYNPSDFNDVSYNEMPLSTVGWIVSGVAICIALFVMIYYYLINQYKPLAALEGANTSINIVKRIF